MRRNALHWLRPLAAVALALPLLVPVGMASAQEETEAVEWISEGSGTVGGRELPAVSADGRYVVFVGRSSANMGVWIRDRAAGSIERLTSGSHFNPAISADGRWVAYAQYGTAGQGIYLLEWQVDSATPQLVSVADNGAATGAPTDFPSISANGRWVAFQAYTSTLDDDVSPGVTGGGPSKVYVRDTLAGDTEMVSVTNANEIINGNANRPDITPDGRYVVFSSDASVLQVPGLDASAAPPDGEDEEETFVQVYRHDRDTNDTLMVSVASDRTAIGDGSSATAYGATISDDGIRVAFESDATNLVADDTNANTDAFVHDVSTMQTIRVSLDENGDEVVLVNPVELVAPTDPVDGEGAPDLSTNAGAGPAISGDGRQVAFESAGALTPDDLNTPDPVETYDYSFAGGEWTIPIYTKDVYRRNLDDDSLVRSSAATAAGVEATGLRTDGMGTTSPANNGVDPAINQDGRLVSFVSNGNLNGERPAPEEDPTAELWEPAVWAHYDLSALQSLRFVPMEPCALFDTRAGTGEFAGPVDGGDTLTFRVASDTALPVEQGGEGCTAPPAHAVAIELNLVAASPHGSGNLLVSSAGTPARGGVVNFTAGNTNASSVPVEVDGDGRIDVEVNGTIADLVDVRGVALGYYVDDAMDSASLLFVEQTACNVFDTRAAGGALAAGETRTFDVAGSFDAAAQGGSGCVAPPEGAVGALVNLVAIQPEASGNLRAVAEGGVATGGVVNFVGGGGNNSNAVPIGLSIDGQIDVTANSPGAVHVRGVVLGYYVEDTHAAAVDGLELVVETACAVFDTRSTIGRMDADETLTATIATDGVLPPQGQATCMPPPGGAEAVVLNLVAIGPVDVGNLRLSPAGVLPEGGVVNFDPARGTNSNAVVTATTAGEVDVTVNALVPDVAYVRGVTLGWYLAP